MSVRRAAGDDDIAIMTISDNGKGFKAKAEDKRHGLGLVRRLLQQVRGFAIVDSDHGTVWTIRFPTVIAADPARVNAAPHRSRGLSAQRGEVNRPIPGKERKIAA